MNISLIQHPRQRGFSFMEILVAIMVFAIGMMALSQFQGSLTRSSADANARTVALNLAEEIIEQRRGFGLLEASTDPAALPSYSEIVGTAYPRQRGGLNFTVTEAVSDYYYDVTTDGFTLTDNTSNKTYSDMKLLTVNVTWLPPVNEESLPAFRVDRNNEISVEAMGSGSVQLSTVIKSTIAQSSGRLLSEENNRPPLPLRPYAPGSNPDVVSLNLGQNKFKESLTPEPKVITQDELVETTFDVITYSQTGDDSVFLRREEFRIIACHCELQAPSDEAQDGGARPTIWAADEYQEGELVEKARGLSVNTQQSDFCPVCCADHHDGGSADSDDAQDPGRSLYDPWRVAGDYWTDGVFEGDHKHYDRDRRGNLVLADEAGDRYYETCRLVRKDGFWWVGQDLRRESLNVFPFDYLDDSVDVADYSAYVTTAVQSFEAGLSGDYPASAPPPALSPPTEGTFPDSTTVPTYTGLTEQQLRSRGIYVDYISRDVREVIDCLQAGYSVVACSQLDGNDIKLDRVASGNVLELIPFFDVQLTWLTRWTESPVNDPIDVTNEALETGNTHSRGVARRGGGAGTATVSASGHRGNSGLTDTDPIDQRFEANVTAADLLVTAVSENPPPPAQTVQISGRIVSGISGVQATKVEITAADALCNRTIDGFVCWVSGGDPVITVSNYKKQNTNMVACSDTLRTTNQSITANNPTTSFSLLDVNGDVADTSVEHIIFVAQDSCPVY